MSSSTESLKKKVCVTVFLDELFEEVVDEDCGNSKHVSEVTDSGVKLPGRAYTKKPSLFEMGNHVSPTADAEKPQLLPRPRKYRRESKFSKNHYGSFKNELNKRGFAGNAKAEGKDGEGVESAFSDSDMDLEEYIEFEKRLAQGSRSSISVFTEFEFTEESLVSLNQTLSTLLNGPDVKKATQTIDANIQSDDISYSNKSTQFDEEEVKIGEKGEADISLIQKISNPLTWKNIQTQCQLILPTTKGKYEEMETLCGGDRIRHYELRLISEESEKTERTSSVQNLFLSDVCHPKKIRPDFSLDSSARQLSDSYTCVFPHNKKRNRSRLLELKRNWSKRVWNEGFESEMPIDSKQGEEVDVNFGRKGPTLCYSLCIRCRKNVNKGDESQHLLDTVNKASSCDTLTLNADANLALTTLNQLVDKAGVGEVLEKDQSEPEETKKDVGTATSFVDARIVLENRNKNYAEGDTVEKNHNSKLILDLESKEKLLVCEEILKHVGEANAIPKRIIVNRAEIELTSPEKARKKSGDCIRLQENDGEVAEVFVKRTSDDNSEKMTDRESETIFAESETFCDREDFLYDTLYSKSTASYTIQNEDSEKDVCVMEFEDRLSHLNVLRRMKTVEILGNSSMTDMRSISTEVILICENISNSDVCLEAWQSSGSTLKSLSEMGQCYLKDCKDSSMYLIEIPLHFTQARRQRFPESDPFFRLSDSD